MTAKQLEKSIFSGKRKTAIAKLRLSAGKGNITYNQLPHS